MNGGDLGAELKKLIEGLHPDMRRYFRPSLLGKVVAVHDDDSDPETYYRVDVVVGADEENGQPGLSLPDVPCASIFAQDGYGVFALPEVDAEVSISFYDGDPTRPYVEAPIFQGNQAPKGFKAGTFAIRGKHGQKIEMKATSNEIVMSCASLKLITTDKRQEHTSGDQVRRIRGKRKTQVDGADILSCNAWNVNVTCGAFIQCASMTENVKGDKTEKIGGSHKQNVGGSVSRNIAGGSSETVAMNKREAVGGSYEILVAATPGMAPTPTPGPTAAQFAAYKVIVNLGGIAFDCLGGQIDIGTNPALPPTMINIGALTSGPINLGGIGAVGQPLPNGASLFAFLTMLLEIIKTVPLQLGNLGAPTAPNPAMVAVIQAMQSSMLGTDPLTSPINCKRVFASLV